MYCPKCSQLQSSDNMRFCSRCGFALAGVAMLMDTDGVVPQPTGVTVQKLPQSRKRLMAESGIFTAISWAALIVATYSFDYGGPQESLAKLAAVLFFFLGLIGLIRFLYGFLFVKDVIIQPVNSTFPRATAPAAMPVQELNALPAQRDWVATDHPRRENTQEMAARPSVTENTTKLLQDPPTEQPD
jgi:hypothetical protein